MNRTAPLRISNETSWEAPDPVWWAQQGYAVINLEGLTDGYRDFFTPGGVVENGFARVWLFLSSRAARLNSDLANERGAHPLRDAWWDAITPDLSKITAPILVCASFSDANLHSVGSMRGLSVRLLPASLRLCPPRTQMGNLLRRGGARTPTARSSTGTSAKSTHRNCLGSGWRYGIVAITSSR